MWSPPYIEQWLYVVDISFLTFPIASALLESTFLASIPYISEKYLCLLGLTLLFGFFSRPYVQCHGLSFSKTATQA